MMNRPKIEECTREITSYELDGSETKQKVTDLKNTVSTWKDIVIS